MDLPKSKTKPVKSINDYTFLIYGEPKVGKTTLTARFDRALFIATEPGHKFQEIYKVDPKNWEDVREVCAKLIKNKAEHDFKTIIFDTVDNAYKMCSDYVNKKQGVEHESDGDYGKVYALIKDEFMRIVNALGQHGFGIVFISHAQVKDLEENGVKRSVTTTTLSASASKLIQGLCDFILYCFIDGSGNRLIKTKGTPNLKAGDRSGILPDLLPLNYDALKDALENPKPTNKTNNQKQQEKK